MARLLWTGHSPVDGAPIGAFVVTDSKNAKNGKMAQVFIMRTDVNPVEARRDGRDESVCGSCALRNGSCYVVLAHGPRSVYAAYQRGNVGTCTVEDLRGLKIRWGAYGDPAMLPIDLVRAVNAVSAGWTGYTHQWLTPHGAQFRGLLMASADNPAMARKARLLGWPVFRAGAMDGSDRGSAVVCPSEHGATCDTCMLCDGRSDVEVYIPAHGAQARKHPSARKPRLAVVA